MAKPREGALAADVGGQMLTSEGGACGDEVDWSAFKNDTTTFATSARTKIDNPVGVSHDGLMMLHHNDGLARVNEAVEQTEEVLDVSKMEARRWFIEDVDACLLGQVRNELEPLAFSAGQRGERLAQAEVAKTDIDETFKNRVSLRRAGFSIGEELRCFGY